MDCVEQVFNRAYAEELLPQLRSFECCANVAGVMDLLALSPAVEKKKAMQS